MNDMNVRHRRVGALVAGALGVVALSLTAATTLGGFSSAVTANATGNTGTLVLALDNGSVWCDSTGANGTVTSGTLNSTGGTVTAANSAACAASGIDLLSPSSSSLLSPGGTALTTSIRVNNLGNLAANTLALDPSGLTCVQSNASGTPYHGSAVDLCAQTTVTIKEGATTIFTGPMSGTGGLAGHAAIALNSGTLAAGATDTLTITTSVASSLNNTYQGLSAKISNVKFSAVNP